MDSFFMMASALEIGLVVLAAVIFLTMVVAGLAVLIWSVVGVVSATHQTPTPHH
jgi:hypothetical protein